MVLLKRPAGEAGFSPAGEAGFSMIEALVASLILLVIALGLVPLFSRSIGNNMTGNDSLQSTNFGRAQLEELIQLPFNNQGLDIPAGTPLGQGVESWTIGSASLGDANEGWAAGASPSGRGSVLWRRTTRVRQYGVSDLEDGTLTSALPGGTQPIFVHLKEVEVQLDSGRTAGALGQARPLTLRVLKPF
jgi:type II secretory pathway pseudopilin PulG